MTSAPPDARLEADALLRERRFLDALDVLARANSEIRDPELDRELVTLRRAAYPDLLTRNRASAVRPAQPAAAPEAAGVPEIDAGEVSAALLRGAIERYGCLLVRGLGRGHVSGLPEQIDHVLRVARSRSPIGWPRTDRTWYAPLRASSRGRPLLGARRRREQLAKGSFLTADSPRVFAELCDLLVRTGVGDLAGSYLGERPAFGYQKAAMRRVMGEDDGVWHQDGAFLGPEVRSLNMWMALSKCGIDAPSVDVVPKRIEHIVETGTDGAHFDWSLAPDRVVAALPDTAVVRPTFDAGDVLFFDHFLLHRPGGHAEMPLPRYSIECWFFSPTRFPTGQHPLVF